MQHDDLPKREIESRNPYHMISLKNFGIISKLDIVLLLCNSNTMQIAIFPCFFFFISDSDRHSLANSVSIKILKLSDLKDQVPPPPNVMIFV